MSGRASTPRPHLAVDALKLEPLALLSDPAPTQLTAPCLGCVSAPVFRLPPTPAQRSSLPGKAALSGLTPAAARAQKLSNAMYIGDTWSFGKGRELSLHLTPNEGHCAPLMRLTF